MNFLNKIDNQRTLLTKILLSVLAGAFYALGFPSNFFPSSILFSHIGIFLFFLIISKIEDSHYFAKIILLVWAFSIGHTYTGFYWISYTLEVFGGLLPPWNYLLNFIFSLIVIPHFFILAFLVFFRKKVISHHLLNRLAPLLLASCAVLLENFFPQQFPAHFGHTWMHLAPYLSLTPLGGVPLYSLMSYYLIFSFIDYIHLKQKKQLVFSSICFTIFLISNAIFPLNSLPWKDKALKKKINLRIVQGNIGNFLKISAEGGLQTSLDQVFRDFYELSLEQLPPDNDLIIWPETAYPRLMNSEIIKKNPNAIPDLMKRVLINSQSSLLVGGYDFAKSEDHNLPDGFMTEYNSAFYLTYDFQSGSPLLQGTYHKNKLIPFGEGLPFGDLNPFLGKYLKNISFFASGQGPQEFKTKNGHSFFPIICYEALFSSFVSNFINQLPSTNFILNITNDSWYGRTSEPFQHLFLAKWRALEFQIPIVRSTNTGITSVIYPDGSESLRSKLFEKTYQDHTLSFPQRRDKEITIFAQFGHLVWIFFTFLLALIQTGYFFLTNPSRSKS